MREAASVGEEAGAAGAALKGKRQCGAGWGAAGGHRSPRCPGRSAAPRGPCPRALPQRVLPARNALVGRRGASESRGPAPRV